MSNDLPEGRWRFVGAAEISDQSVKFDELTVRSSIGQGNDVLGALRGFIVDADTGQLHYVVVDSGGWFTGGSYLLPPAYTKIDNEQQVIWADVTRATIERFPEFDKTKFPRLSREQIWAIEQRIIAAYGDDPGVVAPEPGWERTRWSQAGQPAWWDADGVRPFPATPAGSTAERAGTAPSRLPDRDTVSDRAFAADRGGPDATGIRPPQAPGFGAAPGSAAEQIGTTHGLDPTVGRARPGDVLGLERGGETTHLGDDATDEDDRRRRAEDAVRDGTTVRDEVRSKAGEDR